MFKKIFLLLLIAGNYQTVLTQPLYSNRLQINKAPYGVNSFIKWEREPLISGNQLLLINDYFQYQIEVIPKIACFDLEKKKILWERQFKRPITGAAATSEHFLVAVGNRVIAFEKLSGEIVWKRIFDPPTEVSHLSIEMVKGTEKVIVVAPHIQTIQILDSQGGEVSRTDSVILRRYPPQNYCHLFSITESEYLITAGNKLLKTKNGVVEWKKNFESSYFRFLGSGDLDGDGKKDILVSSPKQIDVFSPEGNHLLHLEEEDNYESLQIVEFKNKRYVLGNYARGALVLIDNEGNVKWEFYNPAKTEPPTAFAKLLMKAFGKGGYSFVGNPLIYDGNQYGKTIIIAPAGGRIYILNMKGQLVKQLDLVPHDKNMFNTFAEAKYPIFIYKENLIVIASAFEGEVIEKDQPGDFQVTDFIFYVDLKNIF